MTTATAQTITVDRDELREITINLGAIRDYLELLVNDEDWTPPPVRRIDAIMERLHIALGLITPDASDLADGVSDDDLDALYDEEDKRAQAWLSEDREALGAVIGRKLLRHLDG